MRHLTLPSLLLVACASTATSEPANVSSAGGEQAADEQDPLSAEGPEPTNIRLSLESASVQEAARLLSSITGEPVVLTHDVDQVASCLGFSVINESLLTRTRAVAVLEAGLRGAGVTVDWGEAGFVLAAEPGSDLGSCPAPRAEVRPLSADREPAMETAAAPHLERGRANLELNALLDGSVRRVNDTEHLITRAAVNAVLENQAELMRSARVIPHHDNGQVTGVRVYGLRRASLLGRLGFRNGDEVRTINGYDLTSPDSALEAYARLRGADTFAVSIVRRGQPAIITVRVVDTLP